MNQETIRIILHFFIFCENHGTFYLGFFDEQKAKKM